MAVTDVSRNDLFQYLRETMGEYHAETLMDHLPPVGWADVATKQDLEHLAVLTRRDLEAARVELKADIKAVRLELKADIKAVRLELKADIADVRTELANTRADVHRDMRNLAIALVTTNVALLGIAVATVRFL